MSLNKSSKGKYQRSNALFYVSSTDYTMINERDSSKHFHVDSNILTDEAVIFKKRIVTSEPSQVRQQVGTIR